MRLPGTSCHPHPHPLLLSSLAATFSSQCLHGNSHSKQEFPFLCILRAQHCPNWTARTFSPVLLQPQPMERLLLSPLQLAPGHSPTDCDVLVDPELLGTEWPPHQPFDFRTLLKLPWIPVCQAPQAVGWEGIGLRPALVPKSSLGNWPQQQNPQWQPWTLIRGPSLDPSDWQSGTMSSGSILAVHLVWSCETLGGILSVIQFPQLSTGNILGFR